MVPYLRHCVWAWALRRDCVRKTCTSTPPGSPTSATDSESKCCSNIVLGVFYAFCVNVRCEISTSFAILSKNLLIYLLILLLLFHRGITERIPNVVLNGHPEKRYIGNLNFSFAFVEGESLLMVSYLVIFCRSVFS